MPQGLMTQEASLSALLAYVFTGALGSAEGKYVYYSLLEASSNTFSWMATLKNHDSDLPSPSNRYRIDIDRRTEQISRPEPIVMHEREIAGAIFAATSHRLASFRRFTDGRHSISYKVQVRESPDIAYVVQLRHHGRVASMNAFMTLVSRTCDSKILPVPPVFPIPGERARQMSTGMGTQITQFIPGVKAEAVYTQMAHEDRLILVRKMALAFQACWKICIPIFPLIGEVVADMVHDSISLGIEPARHDYLGGPFYSVRDYLQAYIRFSLRSLEREQGIEEYKERFLGRIKSLVENNMGRIPAIVEDVPVVAIHTDMSLHNVIVSEENHTEIQAIIDWEFIASAPYASLDRVIEVLFRKQAENGMGIEYERADELRHAFWDAIPNWKRWQESEATQTFLEWHRFAEYMKPFPKPTNLPQDEADRFWRGNIEVVENILSKYSGVW